MDIVTSTTAWFVACVNIDSVMSGDSYYHYLPCLFYLCHMSDPRDCLSVPSILNLGRSEVAAARRSPSIYRSPPLWEPRAVDAWLVTLDLARRGVGVGREPSSSLLMDSMAGRPAGGELICASMPQVRLRVPPCLWCRISDLVGPLLTPWFIIKFITNLWTCLLMFSAQLSEYHSGDRLRR
jgi:hypothetical protein